jgi:subtilisin family serine protease
MWMSGTSFAAPIVAGAAAALLAAHPDWTPDDVKGALMLTAAPAADRAGRALGVGEVKAAQAAAVEDPPNPNLALQRFVVPSGNGRAAPAFDAAAWTREASSDASWSSATWAGASWSSASWSSASWSSAAWSSASWSSASWSSGSRPDGTLPASTEGMWKP